MSLPKKVTICESGLRDGIQNEKVILTVEQKLEIINDMLDAGFTDIECGSFVRPDKVPAMANSKEVFKALKPVPGVDFAALIPNMRGLEAAIECGVKLVSLGVSASPTHAMKNYGKTPEESLEAYSGILKLAKENGVVVRSSVQSAFGSPWEPVIPMSIIKHLVETYKKNGVDKIILADTASTANPVMVYNMVQELDREFPGTEWLLHLHNARGFGLSNMLAGLEAGVTKIATASAGLGGCPFVPNAAGNLSTEDTVYLLSEMGIDTGIDMEKAITIGKKMQKFVGKEGSSGVLKAGRVCDLINFVKDK